MVAAACLGSPGRGHAADSLRFPDNQQLESFGHLVEDAPGSFKGAGERTEPFLGSEFSVPIVQIFDFRSRSLSITQLKDPPPPPQSLTVPAAAGTIAAVPANASGGGTNISRDGATVVGRLDNGFFTPFHAFRWTEGAGIVDLGTLDPPNNATRSSFATDVGDNGSVIVGHSQTSTGATHAFRWTAGGGMVDLGTGLGPAGNSAAFGVSGDGSIVVGQSDFPPTPGLFTNTRQAFRWTQAGGFQTLGTINGIPNSIALAVTADGSTIVGRAIRSIPSGASSISRSRAFRWTEAGGMVDLGVLPGDEHSSAVAVSDDGTIVVGISSTALIDNNGVGQGLRHDEKNSRAFYWTQAGGIKNLTQLLADAGVDMSRDPLVAATGMTPDAKWIAAVTTRPDPEFPELFVDRIPIYVSLTETLPPPSRLLNLSTRAQTLTGANVLIPGFVVQGTTPKRLLIRAAGPTLAGFGVAGFLIDPVMTLKRTVGMASVDVASNNDWGTNANAAEIAATATTVGAFPLGEGSRDAALLIDLEPGGYTVVTEGVGGATGVAIVEVYDAGSGPAAPRLINISTRGFVGTGEDIMIAGFVVSTESSGQFLIRAVGPTLASFGVGGVVADPRLRVLRRENDGSSTEIFANDDWGSVASAPQVVRAAQDVGAFPLPSGSKDAAVVVPLLPGSYTVQVTGAATGAALVEVYEIR